MVSTPALISVVYVIKSGASPQRSNIHQVGWWLIRGRKLRLWMLREIKPQGRRKNKTN